MKMDDKLFLSWKCGFGIYEEPKDRFYYRRREEMEGKRIDY